MPAAPVSARAASTTSPRVGIVRGKGAPGAVPLTVVMPTLNEAAQIGAAIADLSWADEVIVVDGGSTDDTVALAEAAGARVLRAAGETIAGQRNLGIAGASNHWILALDADERVTLELQAEIGTVVCGSGPTHAAYRMQFRNYYLGRELRHGKWARDWHVRLFTRERRYRVQRVHERLEPIGDIGTLSGKVLHHPYRDIVHHVAKIVTYARWGADDLARRGDVPGPTHVVLRPAWRFFRDYVVLSGWRDGLAGFIAAVLSAFAVFLKYALLLTRPRSKA